MTFQPGDWFECRNQELMQLLQSKSIRTSAEVIRAEIIGSDAGVLALTGAEAPEGVERYGMALKRNTRISLPWARTLILRRDAAPSAETAALGMMRLDDSEYPAWEMVARLESFQRLARDVGTPEEQALTLAALGDLRLPVYDAGMIWVRRTPTTEEVIQLWRAEIEQGHDPQHAFLRAVYSRPVALCTLPADWMGSWIGA